MNNSYTYKYNQQNKGMKERFSGIGDAIEEIDSSVKKNVKCNKLLTENIQEIRDTLKSPS